MLAEVALPRQIRAQQAAYVVHPALLDACFQAVGAHPNVQSLCADLLALPLGAESLRVFASARTAQYCYVRITRADSSCVTADLNLLDADGATLLSVKGLRFSTSLSDVAHREQVFAECLSAVEWQPGQLPTPDHPHHGHWLLIDASADSSTRGDSVATGLAGALVEHGAQTTVAGWSTTGDHDTAAAEIETLLSADTFSGVVVLCGPRSGGGLTDSATEGREQVTHLARICRRLTVMPGRIPDLAVVTTAAQSVLPEDVLNLAQGGIRGLMRVVATEHPHLQVRHIDIDCDDRIGDVAAQLLSGSAEDETAWRNGSWFTARLRPSPLRPEERKSIIADFGTDGVRLHIRTPGDLETLELVSQPRVSPEAGQIEVAVTVSSINFADVLVAMGLFPSINGELPELGMDFAGIVTAVGPDVTGHRIGDRVAGVSRNGCWGTYVTCDSRLAVTLPTALSDQEAVATATATATAWYGLHEQARIGAGDRVLIHSAAGGVGQAAIAIARAVGAEIFATAGSESRREFLRDMGISHVYDSRNTDFAEQIRQDTGGYGVDIVLNSLTGAAQRAGFELLAIGGRFIEIGKRDVYDNTRLGLFPFHRNLTFYYLDLALMTVSHPQRVGDLLGEVFRRVAAGDLPSAQYTSYPLADAARPIRLMSAAQHTGKLLLETPHAGSGTVIVPPMSVPVFRNDGAYAISGGLGGLGLFFAEIMATDQSSSGCGRIVLTSRGRPTAETLATIERIRSFGTDVVVECGDIADPEVARRVVATATATGLPLRGVLHAAAVVDDATLANISDDLIARDWAPKVYGAVSLHEAARGAGQNLDWFCSFSSAAALVGSPGQGAYAAANSWLDVFTRWQRTEGVPAVCIAWGAWTGVGRATTFAEQGGAAVTPDEGAYALDMLLRYDRAYAAYAPLMDAPWLATFAQRSAFAEAFRSVDQNRNSTSALRSELDDLPPEEWPARLRRLVSEQVSLILRRSVDPDRPLSEYGVDSLGALELRTRIETETAIRLTSGDIAVATIRSLADLLVEKLTAADGSTAT